MEKRLGGQPLLLFGYSMGSSSNSVSVMSFHFIGVVTSRRNQDIISTGIRFRTELRETVQSGGRPAIPAHCPTDYRQLIEQCWATDPAGRPSFSEIVRKRVFSDLGRSQYDRGSISHSTRGSMGSMAPSVLGLSPPSASPQSPPLLPPKPASPVRSLKPKAMAYAKGRRGHYASLDKDESGL